MFVARIIYGARSISALWFGWDVKTALSKKKHSHTYNTIIMERCGIRRQSHRVEELLDSSALKCCRCEYIYNSQRNDICGSFGIWSYKKRLYARISPTAAQCEKVDVFVYAICTASAYRFHVVRHLHTYIYIYIYVDLRQWYCQSFWVRSDANSGKIQPSARGDRA